MPSSVKKRELEASKALHSLVKATLPEESIPWNRAAAPLTESGLVARFQRGLAGLPKTSTLLGKPPLGGVHVVLVVVESTIRSAPSSVEVVCTDLPTLVSFPIAMTRYFWISVADGATGVKGHVACVVGTQDWACTVLSGYTRAARTAVTVSAKGTRIRFLLPKKDASELR